MYFSGHHARLLCARYCGTQNPEWAEETGDGGKINGNESILQIWLPLDFTREPFVKPLYSTLSIMCHVCLFVFSWMWSCRWNICHSALTQTLKASCSWSAWPSRVTCCWCTERPRKWSSSRTRSNRNSVSYNFLKMHVLFGRFGMLFCSYGNYMRMVVLLFLVHETLTNIIIGQLFWPMQISVALCQLMERQRPSWQTPTSQWTYHSTCSREKWLLEVITHTHTHTNTP